MREKNEFFDINRFTNCQYSVACNLARLINNFPGQDKKWKFILNAKGNLGPDGHRCTNLRCHCLLYHRPRGVNRNKIIISINGKFDHFPRRMGYDGGFCVRSILNTTKGYRLGGIIKDLIEISAWKPKTKVTQLDKTLPTLFCLG